MDGKIEKKTSEAISQENLCFSFFLCKEILHPAQSISAADKPLFLSLLASFYSNF